MHVLPQQIPSDSPVIRLSDIARQDLRARSLEAMQLIVLNDIQQGEPATCSALADFCASQMDHDITIALMLSRIHRDNRLQGDALKCIRLHVSKCQQLFVAAEVERRIQAAGAAEVVQ